MSNYINDLNDLITAKSEIKNIIQDTLNENPSEVFSYYPSYIARIAASSEGPYVVSYSYLSENYPDFTYLYAYVADAVESGGGSIDLSSYVTYAYLASKDYVDYNTFNDLVNEVYLDEDAGGSGTFKASLKDVLEESGLIYEADADIYDVMDIQSTIDSTVEDYLANSSYITMGNVSACGYITSGDVSQMGYITASDLPVINENLIPKKNLTYQLGDRTHNYKSTYTSSLKSNDSGITIQINDTNKYYISSSAIRPTTTNNVNLGAENYYYAYTYTQNLLLENNTGLSKSVSSRLDINLNGDNKFYVGSGGLFPVGTKQLGSNGSRFSATYTENLYAPIVTLSYSYNSIENVNNTRINFKVNQNNRCKLTNVEFAPVVNNGINLGTSLEKFNKTYTSTLYADNAYISNYNNFIWTGTSAQYAALDNYTTYQFYLVQES